MSKDTSAACFAVLAPAFQGVFEKKEDFESEVKDAPWVRIRQCRSRSEAALCLRKPHYLDMSSANIENAERRCVFSEDNSRAYAFVDGSFNRRTGVSGYGGFIDYQGTRHIISGSQKAKSTKSGSLEAEINGMLALFDKIQELDIHDIIINHDYMACQDWARGKGNPKNCFRKQYLSGMQSLNEAGIVVRFNHIMSHKTNKQAEKRGISRYRNSGLAIADHLAREAVGLACPRPLPRAFFNVSKRFSEDVFDIV